MRVTIVHTSKDDLTKCLDSLKRYSPELPIDFLKVENPSETTDPLIEYNKYFETMKDDIIIWHPDMIAKPHWYERVKVYWNYFDVIGLKLLYPNGLIQHFGGAIRPDGGGCHPEQYLLNIGYTYPQDVAYVTGPGTIIKKKVLKKIGGYDLQFIKGFYGDADWCMRAREAGFKVGVIPVEAIHEEQEGGRSKERTTELLKKHHPIFVAKHLEEFKKYK